MSDGPATGNWNQLLERFAETLNDMQQRLAKMMDSDAAETASPSDIHFSALDAAASRQVGLSDRVVEITRWVEAVEEELRLSEELVRVLLSQTEAVREKLTTWTSRAIG